MDNNKLTIIFNFNNNGEISIQEYGLEEGIQHYCKILEHIAEQLTVFEKEHNAVNEFMFLKYSNMFQLYLAKAINKLTVKG